MVKHSMMVKALGELENNKDLTFRNSIIGPDINKNGIGLFNWFMKQNGTINGYTKAMDGCDNSTLAKAIEKAVEDNVIGLYHLVNNEKVSKYELLKLLISISRNNELVINKCDDFIVDKSLINNRKDFNFTVPSYEDMVKEMKEWIIEHKELYPHYLI